MSDTSKREAVLASFGANGWGYPYTEQMADRIVEMEAAVERARALHEPIAKDIPKCVTCKDYDGRHVDHPCPTLRALEGTP